MKRAAELLGALLLAPVLLVWAGISLLACDWASLLLGRKRAMSNRLPDSSAASVVIPNWNGRELLARYLPSVIAAMGDGARHEVIVVDNGSTDGSADYVRERFPSVKVIGLRRNSGFGGGSNAGFRAAKNDIVVLLNSDMRVQPDFLQPLLDGFANDAAVFAVSCQIFLSDPVKRREETGLTQGWWEDGKLRVSHREDKEVTGLFPCFYAGGGSAAFDRAKFLELGGFDELFAPFYLEDTDLGFAAWKRGWKVLYQPASVVFHEHRGTIGKRFAPGYIHSILKKNYLLFTWKNIHGPARLAGSLLTAWGASVASASGRRHALRTDLEGILRAFTQLPQALRSRRRSRRLSVISDEEAFGRSRGSHFRDRFGAVPGNGGRLRILFVSPYPILPAIHGGAVFMLQTLRQLARRCEVHALVLLDHAGQAASNARLSEFCASVETKVRPKNANFASFVPHAAAEFASREVEWLIDRAVYQRQIDVIQMEYTPMGQYLDRFERVGTALFEHDIYFQSVARTARYLDSPMARWKARFEYLRALRFEINLLRRCDAVQVCTNENRRCLLEYEPQLEPRLQAGLRACIDTGAYRYPGGPREPWSMLFIGSARHAPNFVAVQWFLERVFPEILATCPRTRFYLAGFEAESYPDLARNPHIELLGYVEDVTPLLERCALFVCPILSGSGVRVKLLEAFSSGIPVVSTSVGAEGLATRDGELCALADDPIEFARRASGLLTSPDAALEMAARARRAMESEWDSEAVTLRLEKSYRELLERKNGLSLRSAALEERAVEGLS